MFGHRHFLEMMKLVYRAVLILRDCTPPQRFIFLDLSFPMITLKEVQRETLWAPWI